MSLASAVEPRHSAGVNAALLILRIGSGIAFLYHGSAILFGAFGGPGPQRFSNFTHMPLVAAYLVGLAQVAGALAIITGVFFRVGALCVAIVMLGAIFMVHLPHGFDVSKGGFEYALTLFLIAIAFLFTGPGAYSLNPSLPEPLRTL